jgi:non-ribosomal peptide synthetase component F
VPHGEAGMMWVGGAGVSRGYINLPELTSKRYKPNRFLQDGYVRASQFVLCSTNVAQVHDVQHWRRRAMESGRFTGDIWSQG